MYAVLLTVGFYKHDCCISSVRTYSFLHLSDLLCGVLVLVEKITTDQKLLTAIGAVISRYQMNRGSIFVLTCDLFSLCCIMQSDPAAFS